MSKNVVDCVINYGEKYPIGLIASRRQIDFSGGYVNQWNNKTFYEYVKSKKSNIFLCRDHGGELQGKDPDDGIESFLDDCKYFDIVHIDPFKFTKTIEQSAEKTKNIIITLWSQNSNLMYEVGTEEAIFKYEPEDLNWFLKYLKNELNDSQFSQIKYAVVQSGTRLDLSTRTNIGNFNNKRLNKFIEIVKEYDLMTKEHNGDYLTDSFDVEMRFRAGLDAINIAPEYGQIESEFYLQSCKQDSDLFDSLYQICYNSGKWKKWINDISRISKEQLIITCCHYVLSEKQFIEKIKVHFPDADEKIQKKINSSLKLLHEQTKDYCV